MKILIADDDPLMRRMLQATSAKWGYEAQVTCDGASAMLALQATDPPRLALLDWMMPGMDGLQVCQAVRTAPAVMPTYLIMLTGRTCKEHAVAALEAGADDYITKPFDPNELRARMDVGRRIIDLQQKLGQRVQELEAALAQVQQLHGLLPICCYCKKIRDDQNYWQQVEGYIAARTKVNFSHGICPDCWTTVVEPQIKEAKQEAEIEPTVLTVKQ